MCFSLAALLIYAAGMGSTETQIAGDIFQDIVAERHSGTEIAADARETAEDLRAVQAEMIAQTRVILGPQAHAEGAEHMFQQWNLDAAADILEDTGKKVGEIVGSTATKEMEGNVAGYAYQGQEGSTVIDVSAAMHPEAGGTQVIDAGMLQDTVDHEGEHENQAAMWNAQTVSIGNGQELTRTQVSEVGAMSVQQSIDWVSDDYKQMYSFVVGLGVSPEQAREAARTGDLVSLGREVRESRGAVEMQQALSF